MGFKSDCEDAVNEIVTTDFKSRDGTVVPTTDTVSQKDGAVWLTDAAYLYADMADSTGMVDHFDSVDSAKIVRAYLASVCRVLRDRGGEIRSFDGDRVMAIFVGDKAADKAVDAALRMKWVIDEIVHKHLSLYNDAYYEKSDKWRLKHRTGIDIGTAFVVRAGVRGNNDLVSIGETPNIAAKLSDYKGGRGHVTITEHVWDKLSYSYCYSKNAKSGSNEEQSMWTDPEVKNIGGGTWVSIRTSTWRKPYN